MPSSLASTVFTIVIEGATPVYVTVAVEGQGQGSASQTVSGVHVYDVSYHVDNAVFAGHSMGVQTILEVYHQAPSKAFEAEYIAMPGPPA